ncbi:MAG TPA: hypothetical protein VLX44_19055 [Xanthobacteraceae bacterium]|nr:hypothetical protein [Xanthobacteraceae bacterium]
MSRVRTRFAAAASLLGTLASLALANQDAEAQSVVINGARMTWYGAFTISKGRRITEPGGTNGQVQSTAVHPPMVNSERIAFAPDAKFGFGYVLNGRPADARVKLRYVIKIPLPGAIEAATGQNKLLDEGTYPDLRIGRGDLFLGESLAQFKDPPPGPWTVQLWYEDRLLLEKTFTVAK